MREGHPLLKLCELYDDYSIVYDHMIQLQHLASKYLGDEQTFQTLEIRVASYSRICDEDKTDETAKRTSQYEVASLFFPNLPSTKHPHVLYNTYTDLSNAVQFFVTSLVVKKSILGIFPINGHAANYPGLEIIGYNPKFIEKIAQILKIIHMRSPKAVTGLLIKCSFDENSFIKPLKIFDHKGKEITCPFDQVIYSAFCEGFEYVVGVAYRDSPVLLEGVRFTEVHAKHAWSLRHYTQYVSGPALYRIFSESIREYKNVSKNPSQFPVLVVFIWCGCCSLGIIDCSKRDDILYFSLCRTKDESNHSKPFDVLLDNGNYKAISIHHDMIAFLNYFFGPEKLFKGENLFSLKHIVTHLKQLMEKREVEPSTEVEEINLDDI